MVFIKSFSIKTLIGKISVGIAAAALFAAFLYNSFVYSSIPLISYWRTIWIETAMSTGSHHWLATSFIPSDIIEEVMSKIKGNTGVIGGGEYLGQETGAADSGKAETSRSSESETGGARETEAGENTDKDILGQAGLTVGKPDYAGYTVSVNDIEQGIVISDIEGSGYKGKVMLVDDPSRIFLGVTSSPGVEGLRIKDMLTQYKAVAGVNASGFADFDGAGTGGTVVGLCCSQGNFWGEYVNYYGSVVFTKKNKLVVGNVTVWKNYNIRDGIQFGPVLIADGKKQVEGSAGYGIQPRTAIGQREDGAIVFLVIDGRDLTWSIGCTVGDMADILAKYNVVNAACCDGGSSTVMAYNGEVINRNSSANPSLGRRLPNAFLVKGK